MIRRQLDPYRGFRFRLKLSGRDVAGFMECAIAPSRNQAANTNSGQLTLKRGVSEDPQFRNWAFAPGSETGSARQESSDLQLEVLNEAGVRVRRFELRGCRSIFHSADSDNSTNAFSIECIVLEYDALLPVD
jgi:hypothetical protein